MTSFIMKVIICPLVLMLSDWLFAGVEYASFTQAIIVGLILAVVGTLMEVLLLRRGTVWMSTVMDFVATLVIVYFVTNLYDNAAITLWGAVLVSLILGVIEYFTHLWLVRSDKTRKSPM